MKQNSVNPDMTHSTSVLNASLLIAGTSIGAGMLGVPLVTGLSGFIPAVIATGICWIYMLLTGLLFLEATLWMKDGANVLSICENLLGSFGKWLGGACFLFLYYCLLTAYFAAGASLIDFGNHTAALVLLFIFFFTILVSGIKLTDRMNLILIVFMAVSYVLLIYFGSSEILSERLNRCQWTAMHVSFPVLFSAFGYHNIIPSLSTFLNRNTKKLRQSIIIGSSIPAIVYLLWQWIIIGAIPLWQLQNAQERGVPVTELFMHFSRASHLALIASFFSLIAIMTSVLGVSLSMFDFLADGLKSPKTHRSWRFLLSGLVFIPPFLFSLYWPNIFTQALKLAGGFGEAILNGILPVCLVWVGRYQLKLKSGCEQTPFGKTLLIILFLFSLVITLLELGLIQWVETLW